MDVEVFLPPPASTCRALLSFPSSLGRRGGDVAAAWRGAAGSTDPLQLEFQVGFLTVND